MLVFLLIYIIRYQFFQEMNILSVLLLVCFMFLYVCFCMEVMLLIEYEGLMVNENYFQFIIVLIDFILNYYENYVFFKDMIEVFKIYN